MKSNLVINAGSATIKVAFFVDGEQKLDLLYQRRDKKYSRKLGKGKAQKISKADFEDPLKNLLSLEKVQRFLLKHPPQLIGFRVVHGGAVFTKPTKLTKAALKKLKKLDELAPLHNPFARKIIERSEQAFPDTKKLLVFDTSFHQSIPNKSRTYAIPQKYRKGGVKRYGFHGIVCSSIIRQLKEKRKLKKRLVICHLGSGCSVTAVLNGKSADTSMGFTPLEGLVMGSRAGDIDPGLLLYLQKKFKLSAKKLDEILNHDSGLKALAGSSDMRDILKRTKRDRSAELAIEIFCIRVAKYVAAYSISLGGLDQIVFSGGIGEHAPLIRQKICEYLRPLAVRLSKRKNVNASAGKSFHRPFSKIRLSWMHADEAEEINRQLSSR